jgi:hypothetical protein
MSLQPELDYTVPEQTARVARAAFPKGTLCLHIYDQLGTLFRDQDFGDLFPHRGQPIQAPFRLALVTILQFAEGLADRAAADAVRSRIDWKYLLCLELNDAGFDYSVLCEFRARLLESNARAMNRNFIYTNSRTPSNPLARRLEYRVRNFPLQNSVTTVTPATSNLSIFTSASMDCSSVIVLPMSFSGVNFPVSIIANKASYRGDSLRRLNRSERPDVVDLRYQAFIVGSFARVDVGYLWHASQSHTTYRLRL